MDQTTTQTTTTVYKHGVQVRIMLSSEDVAALRRRFPTLAVDEAVVRAVELYFWQGVKTDVMEAPDADG